ncbi:glycoside hydrolase family 13 protein [Streptomyces sp. APSN-46.1]|uniref:glycoside hydrolase family 13 protein n=1 Tax=Streptomyces sp. APSN-46.1 TaxID=2929049 RepID=UPI001FB4C07D|nr:glycoside hydrolase family 13 protein [Streptomyces sp. APSN-46.1]MCJ1677650.1 glycoside hydrolase family 13 protein [Streptomyces sp. APSN-46.1]
MTHELTAPRLASASSNASASSASSSASSSAWWRDAVIYQVYVRSFADSDGDGVGDLRGVRTRLPHLARLGVDAVWLTPFYVSPQADAGYDVADYRAVDPLFGDLADADDLVRAAHALGLRVIVDVVPNHTSEEHAWFRAALAGEPGARERYWFRPGRGADGAEPPNDWESVFGGPAWTRVPDGDWYLHLFAPEQPDLNWDHPEVAEEFASVLRFWLDLGVDGFRVDVAHGLVKAPGLPDIGRGAQATLIGTEPLPFFDQDGVHEIHRSWRRLLDSYEGPRIGVAEAWAPTSERLALYVRPDELHQAFNFRFLNCPWDPASMRTVIDESLAATASVGAPTTWVLSNHDVVRHVTRYGGGEQGLARARAAALLMLALPGSAYVYQGEELGLPEVTDLPDEARQDPAFRRGHRQRDPRAGAAAAGAAGAGAAAAVATAAGAAGAGATAGSATGFAAGRATGFAAGPAAGSVAGRTTGSAAGPTAGSAAGRTTGSAAGPAREEAAGREAAGQDGLRDGCRVPLPWSGAEPPYDFGPAGSWLPQPAGWGALSVAAQTGDPHSTLELYRAALELRRALPGLGAPEAGQSGSADSSGPGDGSGPADSRGPCDRRGGSAAGIPYSCGMRWLPAPEGVLLFSRPGFVCTLNTRATAVELPAPGRPVLSSSPVETDGRTVLLPPDSCTWWAL